MHELQSFKTFPNRECRFKDSADIQDGVYTEKPTASQYEDCRPVDFNYFGVAEPDYDLQNDQR